MNHHYTPFQLVLRQEVTRLLKIKAKKEEEEKAEAEAEEAAESDVVTADD